MKFRKHPNYMGKYLTINVGGGDRRIHDHEILEGPQYHRFVAYGWLLPVDEGEVAESHSKAVAMEDIPKPVDPEDIPEVKTKDAPEEPVKSNKEEGTSTTSPASKTRGSGVGRSRRGS